LIIKKAQAESDKIEIMRDIATYEVNMCDSIGIEDTFNSWLSLLEKTR